jgi:hypothetical protein
MKVTDERITTADVAAIDDKERERRDDREHRDDAAKREARGPAGPEEPLTPLFPTQRAQDLRNRWHDLQVGFVDDPRRTVQQADELVAQVMKDLAQSFGDARTRLEQQWDKGDKVSTEDLRIALRRYRSFLERFLAM